MECKHLFAYFTVTPFTNTFPILASPSAPASYSSIFSTLYSCITAHIRFSDTCYPAFQFSCSPVLMAIHVPFVDLPQNLCVIVFCPLIPVCRNAFGNMYTRKTSTTLYNLFSLPGIFLTVSSKIVFWFPIN